MTDADREPPSKSQRKREMHALRDLGARIAAMPTAQRDALPTSEALRKALAEHDRLRAREAKRRHLSFIGRLMRTEDLEALNAALDRLDAASAASASALHRLEQWRDALIAEDGALTLWCDAFPDTDRPRLRQLVRGARSEHERRAQEPDLPRRAFRSLFRFLRDEAGEQDLPPPPDGGEARS
ncbi:MAG: ribosome biogenesis factor YjgA [Pseudomonadales bacterium]|jgi:ribosome-associated protein|nr:ribosome biogenesis factor YjgA [Pseudomonadales bacterium]